jgi:CDP-paratose 2-epimerase
MSTVLITGAGGLVGSEAAKHFHELGWDVVGIDNDMRSVFFGPEASTTPVSNVLKSSLRSYRHHEIDIRDKDAVERILKDVAHDLELVIHSAAQPSHDWSAKDPATDFSINATATLTILEAVRQHRPTATVLFTSTNKVYGDTPNSLPLIEMALRFEMPTDHPWYGGIPEEMSIDHSTHSLFGVSKTAADLLVQEYGRYFGLRTIVFRCGCLTGPSHAGAELHGFLAYLMKCTASGRPYRVYGYGGRQVRDNIHSADLISAIEHASRHPRPGAVYNMGGGREVNCSMLEAIAAAQEIAGRELNWTYVPENRVGDHKWWIGDVRKFRADHPEWKFQYDLKRILREIFESNKKQWSRAAL